MRKDKSVIIWLFSGCILILIMVVVGGITRLTHSGLSMVNWSLFMGAIPPLSEVQWQETFDLYKNSPEFKKINFNYNLSDFKKIFFWEYIHRLIGRILGLVFIIPFIYFLIKKKLTKKLILQSIILFSMGALQGAIGWWMVKSGLVDNPDVSHYRLAVHLVTAFLTCAFTFWVALPLIYSGQRQGNIRILNNLRILFLLIVIQIIYGAFVAGLNAGVGFNTWPKMNGEWIPQAVYSIEPLWRNFIETPYGIQFIHRSLAIIIVIYILYIWFLGKKINIQKRQKSTINLIFSIVLIQTILGILTLIMIVPLSLALLHQIGAFFLLMSVVYSLFIFKKN
mgnify:CR=1 FL=1